MSKKEIKERMIKQLNDDEYLYHIARKAFDEADKNHNGTIDIKENIRIFGTRFVKNNKGNCLLYINNEKKELTEILNINNLSISEKKDTKNTKDKNEKAKEKEDEKDKDNLFKN